MSTESILVPLNKIDDNPFQMREEYEPAGIEELAIDIFRNSILQIPHARQAAGGRYQLQFGHRRKRAYELLASKGVPGAGIQPDTKYSQMPLIIVDADDFEMFDLGLSENIKRQDLNPIEMAQAMKHYLEFDKTSDQAGEKFGMSGATVRGKVRLLDLPDAAQKELAAGAISEGTARSLLSMAKVADEKAIQKTLKNIKENANNMLPEEIIEHDIEMLGNAVEMWVGGVRRDEGKPRAGHNLWLLDMKNFPNKMLPELMPVDMALALGIQDDQKMIVQANTWLDADKGLLPDLDTETIGLPSEMVMKLDHLVNPPACNACSFYTVINKNHYCGVRDCHARKAQAFRAQKLADASRSSKIAIYQERDGAYLLLDEINASHKKAFADRIPDLRLVPSHQYKGYAWQRFPGLDNDTVKLVVVGESLNKLAVKGSKSVGKKTEKEKAEARAMRLYRQVRKELMWDFVVEAEKIFAGVPINVVERMCGWRFIGMDDRIPEEHDESRKREPSDAFQRRALVWRLITEHSSHYRREELVEQLEAFEKACTVKASKELKKRVKEWDAEIEELARVAVETKGKKK